MSHESKIQSQDGGIGTYTLPPHTTKRRTITNLKTKNNQNCQKIELYRTVWTTKEIKKKHSSRPVGGAEMGSGGGEDLWQGSGWKTRQFHICMRINWEEQVVSKTDHAPQGSSMGK